MSGALFGQGLNFIAMLLPIVGGETGQLVYLMLPLALATVLSRTSILGFHSRYLTLPERRTHAATSVSAASLFTTTLLCMAIGAALDAAIGGSSHRVLELAIWTALLLISHGIYLMAVAVATREQKMNIYSSARLAFGITNIVATGIVIFLYQFREGLIVAAIACPVVASILILSRTQNNIFNTVRNKGSQPGDREHRSYFIGSLRPAAGTFLAESGFQLQGFITPFLGPYQDLWAIVVRLTGGFGTLAQQVIAPPCEAKVAGHLRQGDRDAVNMWSWRILAIGLVLGVGSAIVQAAALILTLPHDPAITPVSLMLVSIFCLFWMPSAMCAKLPLMKGLNRLYLMWSTARLVLLLPLLWLRDDALFIGIIAVMSLTAVALMWTSLRPASNTE